MASFSDLCDRSPIERCESICEVPATYLVIPEVKWFPMGDNEFCAIQGTTDTTLILPSGRTIEEEFSIVYVDRDSEGIFQVKADSLGWLRLDVAEKRLDREVDLMVAEGADKAKVLTQRQSVLDWLTTFDHNSPMRSAIAHSTDQFRLYFGFAVTMEHRYGDQLQVHSRDPKVEKERRAQNTKRGRTSHDAPTGHKLFNFVSISLHSRRWAHIKRYP